MYEWRVNVIAGNFDKDYVSNHLQEVSGILSQNDNLTVNIIQDETASYTIDMSTEMSSARIENGEIVWSGGEAPIGKLAEVTIKSDGTVVSTAHEMGHSAKAEPGHIEPEGNEDNLMQANHNTNSNNTNLTEQQTERMDNHMQFYQQFLD